MKIHTPITRQEIEAGGYKDAWSTNIGDGSQYAKVRTLLNW